MANVSRVLLLLWLTGLFTRSVYAYRGKHRHGENLPGWSSCCHWSGQSNKIDIHVLNIHVTIANPKQMPYPFLWWKFLQRGLCNYTTTTHRIKALGNFPSLSWDHCLWLTWSSMRSTLHHSSTVFHTVSTTCCEGNHSLGPRAQMSASGDDCPTSVSR